MELYYKDLISKDARLDKLVDNLMLVVQGAGEFADAVAPSTAVEKLKEGCDWVKAQAATGARTTKKLVKRHPYSAVGIAFGLGALTAMFVRRSSRSSRS